jgi:hypothetical protein
MNKVKIALASVVVATSMVASSAPALAAPVRPVALTPEQRIAAIERFKTWMVGLNLNLKLRITR